MAFSIQSSAIKSSARNRTPLPVGAGKTQRWAAPLMLAVLLSAGCNNNEATGNDATEQAPPSAETPLIAAPPVEAPAGTMTLCTEPRPEICTMDYNPVCGSLEDGSTKTYSNGCSACSDSAVTGWTQGTCE